MSSIGRDQVGAIEALELRELQLPLITPFETSLGSEAVKKVLLVTLTREGIDAYGECVASTDPRYSEETITSAKYIITQFLAPLVLSRDLESPEEFMRLTDWIRGNNMAVAAVEMALWDLQGKLEGKSLSELIGGRKREVSVGVSVGIQPTNEKLVDVVGAYLRDGYRRVKIKIRPGYDLEPVRALRAKFHDLPLQVDCNSSYRLSDLRTMKELDRFGLLMIEQPLAHDDIVDHAKLQSQLATPICLDESIRAPDDVRRAIGIEACRVVNIKPGRVRGLISSKEIHDVCVTSGVPVWCGGMLETGIGRAFNVALASLQGFTLPSDISASRRYYKHDVITREFELTADGTIEVPVGPGIGVEVNQPFLDSCTTWKETLRA